MPWVLDDDVAVREKERRLDEAYYTRRWPFTDSARQRYRDEDLYEDDDVVLESEEERAPRRVVEEHVYHRGRPRYAYAADRHGAPGHSPRGGSPRGLSPRARARARTARYANGYRVRDWGRAYYDDGGDDHYRGEPRSLSRLRATQHEPRHERHVTVVDHEHPIYHTHETIHRHRTTHYEEGRERHVTVPDVWEEFAPTRRVDRRAAWDYDVAPRRKTNYVYGDMTDAYYLDRARPAARGGDLRVAGDALPRYDAHYVARSKCGCRPCGPESATPYADWANSGFRSGRPAYATTRRFS